MEQRVLNMEEIGAGGKITKERIDEINSRVMKILALNDVKANEMMVAVPLIIAQACDISGFSDRQFGFVLNQITMSARMYRKAIKILNKQEGLKNEIADWV